MSPGDRDVTFICVLGSGSAGNSTLVMYGSETNQQCLLIDAGLSPLMTARRVAGIGVSPRQIRDVILTHLDADHFHTGWPKAIARHGIRLHVHHRHRSIAWQAGVSMKHTLLFNEQVVGEGLPHISSVLLAHDHLGSVGFVVEHAGLRLGYATDLGRLTDAVFDRFTNLHALAIESNYDRRMQIESQRPEFLKRRIMGGAGHLSNEQSLDAVCQIAKTGNLSHIALLHLSQQCNNPRTINDLYSSKAAHLLPRLTITRQDSPSPVLVVRSGTDKWTPSLPRMMHTQIPLFEHEIVESAGARG